MVAVKRPSSSYSVQNGPAPQGIEDLPEIVSRVVGESRLVVLLIEERGQIAVGVVAISSARGRSDR